MSWFEIFVLVLLGAIVVALAQFASDVSQAVRAFGVIMDRQNAADNERSDRIADDVAQIRELAELIRDLTRVAEVFEKYNLPSKQERREIDQARLELEDHERRIARK